MIKVMVIAGSVAVRLGLEVIVRSEPEFALVGEGPRAGDPVHLARQHHPDVLLMETAETGLLTRLPSMAAAMEPCGIVVLANQLTRPEIRRTLQIGVRAILPRTADPPEITAAIKAVACDLVVLAPAVFEAILPLPDSPTDDELLLGEPLTARESEVLSMMAQGAGNREIATRLRISEHTVKFHVSSILAKLGAATRTEAVSRGYREGLILI